MSQDYFVKSMDTSFQPYLSSILWHSWTGMYKYLISSRVSNLCVCPRVNIGNAAVFGLKEDLHLGGVEYNVVLTIFFVPYILCEIPSNLILKKLRPRVWRESPRPRASSYLTYLVSSCMFLFGLVTTLQGLVQSYSGLLTTRFFLGVFEAGECLWLCVETWTYSRFLF